MAAVNMDGFDGSWVLLVVLNKVLSLVLGRCGEDSASVFISVPVQHHQKDIVHEPSDSRFCFGIYIRANPAPSK
jgi:hypothetical protein